MSARTKGIILYIVGFICLVIAVGDNQILGIAIILLMLSAMYYADHKSE